MLKTLAVGAVGGQVAPELRLARCSEFGEGDPLFKTVRFEFGS